MATSISFHRITEIGIGPARKFERTPEKGGTFFSRDICFVFEDGSQQSVSLFSDSAEGIKIQFDDAVEASQQVEEVVQ